MSRLADRKDEWAGPVRPNLVHALWMCILALVLWTLFLGWHLPAHYLAQHWDVVWVGFDIVQAMVLGLTAWLALRRRPLVILTATASATMLFADGWFDVMTARSGDLTTSIVVGVLIEIPGGLTLLVMAVRALHNLVARPSPSE